MSAVEVSMVAASAVRLCLQLVLWNGEAALTQLLQRAALTQLLQGASADTISNVSAQWTDLNETLLHEASSTESARYCFLESLHVFVLAHVTRRPIIVFGRHDQRAGAANMRGIYLPSLLPNQQCSNPSPLLLMYDANHFQPVITVEGAYSLPLSDQFGSLPFRYHENAICDCVLRLNLAGTHCDTAYVHQGFAQLLCTSVSSDRLGTGFRARSNESIC